ncbi:hypothetical protein [Microcoleus sp. S13C4]|uniref:hypothetical protein n=1 Tax=Microcoleus sp. S13C4 TaxID=3055410 RepID=UPI002FD1986A
MKPVSHRTNCCTGRHEYDWLLARSPLGDVGGRYFCLHRLCHTLPYRVLPQLDRRFKSWATGENFLWAGYRGDRQTAHLGNQS